jgi:hypothetical protein
MNVSIFIGNRYARSQCRSMFGGKSESINGA